MALERFECDTIDFNLHSTLISDKVHFDSIFKPLKSLSNIARWGSNHVVTLAFGIINYNSSVHLTFTKQIIAFIAI